MTATVSGFEIQTAGLILMIVGVIGLVISGLYAAVWSDRRRAAGEREIVRDREAPHY